MAISKIGNSGLDVSAITNGSATLTLPSTSGTILAQNSSAPANSLVVDSSGNVGIGTGSPAYKLDVSGSINTSGSVNSVNTFGFKNRIINGGMVIDQRNAGAAVVPNPTTTVYPVDRFVMSAAVTSKFTAQRNAGSVTPPAGFSNYLGCTVTSAYTPVGNESFSIQTRIEGYNTADFAFGTASAATSTLSFWVYSSLVGTYGGEIYSSAARTYPFSYSIPVANTWTKIVLSIAGDTVSATDITNGYGLIVVWGLGAAGTNLGGTINTWQAGNFIQPVGTTSWISNAGATFYITGVQLEKGSVATSFDQRAYSQELAMCQRYYQKSYEQATALGAITTTGEIRFQTAGTGGESFPTIMLPVAMRAIPTITFYSANNGASGVFYNYSTGTNPAMTTTNTNGSRGFSGGAGATATNICGYHFTASAEL